MITNSLEVAATAGTAHAAEPAIAVRGAAQVLRRRAGARRRRPHGPPRRGARPARPQRRRQDHARRDPRGPPQRRRRRRSTSSASTRHGASARSASASASSCRRRAWTRTITVREAIELYGAAYPNPRPADEVLELVGLGDRADARAGTLSGGQRRRLDLALGICGDPELVFLDEPTTGFDPAARRQSWELIERLRALGKTILLTTHYMDEAQHLADRVVVIAQRPRDRRGHARHRSGAAPPRRRSSASACPLGIDADDLPLPDDADIERRDGSVRFRTATPTRDLAPLLVVGRGPRRRARGADRQPAEPRGRLPPADPGDRMTRSRPHARCGRWIVGAREAHAAQPARDVLHVRLPADVPGALQRAQRRRAGRGDGRRPAARSRSRSSTRRRSASSASRSPATRR